ncbi:hypothetical protein [Natrinema sp. DC36]|uniref:hypothetical protein n=1 Tax=Natrinema sp. DC36 TaxID=2878680 RepID=UPI001CF021ED|nr:hypothetical protein [Natrinema sp. DC36]
MAKNNPKNPHTRDEQHIQHDIAPPLSKATVMSADSHPDEDGYHAVKIKVRGENSTQMARVLPFTIGSAYVPRQDDDVSVMYGVNDSAWIVGPWYSSEKIADERANLPDYEPGEVVLGNHTGSNIRIDNDGDIHINSNDGDVYINETKQ